MKPFAILVGGTPLPVLAYAEAGKVFARTQASLYVCRKVLNAEEIIAWAKGAGFETTYPADQMHVTVCYSKTPMDWHSVPDHFDHLRLTDGIRELVRLGPKGAEDTIVLRFTSQTLAKRHREFKEAGASWDYEEYYPHISISRNIPDNLSSIVPYSGRIELGPEIFSEVKSGWADGLKENAYNPDQPRAPAGTLEGGRWTRSEYARTGDQWSAEIKDKYGERYRLTKEIFKGRRNNDDRVRFIVAQFGAPRGVEVGHAELAYTGDRVMSVGIYPEFRRRGIASVVYDAIEKDLGKPLVKNWATTDDGEAFWQARLRKKNYAVWDESKHPRHPAGTDQGGEFAPAEGGPNPPARKIEDARVIYDRMKREGKTDEEIKAKLMSSLRLNEKRAEIYMSELRAGAGIRTTETQTRTTERAGTSTTTTGTGRAGDSLVALARNHEGSIVFARAAVAEKLAAAERGQEPKFMTEHGMAQREPMFSAKMDHTTVYYSANESGRERAAALIAAYARGTVPPEVSFATSNIYITNQKNMHDEHWGRTYNISNFVSAATGGDGSIAFYGSGDSANLDNLRHEMAHNLAAKLYGQTTPPANSPIGKLWTDFKKGDRSLAVTEYSMASPSEMFAETIANRISINADRTSSIPLRAVQAADQVLTEARSLLLSSLK